MKFAPLCYTIFFNGVCDYKYEDILVRFHFLTLHLRRRHLDALFLMNGFKGKISYSDTVNLRIPIGLLETTLLLLYIVISRSVLQPDVFLLPVHSVGASTSLTKIIFCLLMSVSFLNKNNFSLFLYHLLIFNCLFLFLILVLT
jgi:hypothetical protein